MGRQKTWRRMRMHRHDSGVHHPLVALIQPGDLIFFLLLKEIPESYREHDDSVEIMLQAHIQ